MVAVPNTPFVAVARTVVLPTPVAVMYPLLSGAANAVATVGSSVDHVSVGVGLMTTPLPSRTVTNAVFTKPTGTVVGAVIVKLTDDGPAAITVSCAVPG